MNNQMRAVGIRVYAENKGVTDAMREVRREMDETAKTAEKASGKTGKASDDAAQKVKRGNDETRTSLKATERAYKEHGDAGESAFKRVGSSIAKLAGAAGLGMIGKQIYDVGMGFLEFKQNSELAFTTMLGSGDKARTFLAEMLDFAKETPFAFTDLTDSAQRMLSFGIETEKVIPILRTLGDTALGTGGGVEKMNGIVTAISQISAKGRLQSEEILQLAERGVPALRILANQAGKTAGAFQKDVTKGLIDADQAIEWLVDGLQNGTEGINGTTAAFGGLMEQVKGSGGVTATFDSAKSAFRNMAGAIMDGLAPSIITLVNAGSDLMGVVQKMAKWFADLPRPIRDAALAVTALMIAQRLLRTETGQATTGALRSFATGIADSARATRAMSTEMGAARTSMALMKSSAAGVKSALMGAFGGPVGLAITGVTIGLSALAGAQANARARTQELKDSLDQTTAALTEQSRALMYDEIFKSDRYERINSLAEKLGITMTDVVSLGLNDATEATAALGAEIDFLSGELAKKPGEGVAPFIERTGMSADDARVKIRYYNDLMQEMGGFSANTSKAQQELRDKIGAVSGPVKDVADAYSNAARQALVLADAQGDLTEVGKAVQAAADEAAKAFASGMSAMGMKLNLSTDKDVETARDAVTKATNSVKDAEGSLAKARSAKKPDAETIRRAEQSLADARKAAKEASENLAATEKRNDPVGQYRRSLNQQRKDAEKFRDDMIKLAERGLNGKSLQELLAQGVEGSADTRKALLGDKKLIGETNTYQEDMAGIAGELENLARLNATRLQYGGQLTAEEFNLGLNASLMEGAATSMQDLVDKLGEDPARIREIGRLMGLEFIAGFTDTPVPWADPKSTQRNPMNPLYGYANGGIYPGYTPGRDIGYIGISGGEAIMRPEFTRAVGADWVHRMNALARSVGVGGVQKEMGRYLGGFANGGIPAPAYAPPQVIRLMESHTTGYPMTVENVNLVTASPDDFARQMRARRRAAWTGGRP